MTEISKWYVRDVQATCVAVDRSGNGVLFGGKRWLAIKLLDREDDAEDSVKKIPRQSKYDVAGAEWCQTQQGQRLCAISSNQRVDVYHWRNGDLTAVHSLRGHTRAVSDTHWHREDHNLIATCSIDTFTHLWDLRDSRRPALSLSAVAGASQVQWNKAVGHLLATAHDGDVKLWDRRKGTAPVQYISAHLCKIHGLDWSPHHDYQLATSSHDGTVKYFDVNSPRRATGTVSTGRPVWRAMYTPFGGGLVTSSLGWGGDHRGSIGVWVDGRAAPPLVGHSDLVLQMQWRPSRPPDDHQLLTWSRDQTLRLWSMSPLFKMCSHYLPLDDEEPGGDGDDDASETTSVTSSADAEHIKMIKITGREAHGTLAEELETIKSTENVSMQELDLERRTCTVRVQVNSHIATLHISYSCLYPCDGAIPRFAWLTGTNLDPPSTIKILQAINRAAHIKIRQQSVCTIHCLRVLFDCLQQIPVKQKEDGSCGSKLNESGCDGVDRTPNTTGDQCIPFPRTCGAKWCGVGILVVFNRPPNAKRLSLKPESATPRSMSSLSAPILIGGAYRSPSPHPTASPSPTNLAHHRPPPTHFITTFYFQDRWKASSRRSGGGLRSMIPQFTPKITLYTIEPLFYLSKPLAEKYIIDGESVPQMCEHNARVAASLGRYDLMRTWQISALTAASLEKKKENSQDDEDGIDWSLHPFGANMMQALINHYAKISDIQTAAMLCCAFSSYYGTCPIGASKSSDLSTNSNGSSPYNTEQNISEMSAESWAVPMPPKPDRPSSWSDSTDFNASLYESLPLQHGVVGRARENASTPILDLSTVNVYRGYMRAYADILHRWNLLGARAEVMKHAWDGSEARHSGVELVSKCQRCELGVKGGRCARCSVMTLSCVVCNVGVRGSANACLICGHGGHTKHLEEWFGRFDVCPTGCGCRCLHETGNTMER